MTASQPVPDVPVGTARARPDQPRHAARTWFREDVSPSDGAVGIEEAVEDDVALGQRPKGRFLLNTRRLSTQGIMGRGQMRILNNRESSHHRSEFEDGNGVQQERHFVQPWFRQEDRPFFGG